MILYLDCANGISGDMLVAALLDLAGGVSRRKGPLERVVRPALKAAGIDPRLVVIEPMESSGVAALSFRVADAPGFASFDELILAMYASRVDQAVADDVAAVAQRMAAAEREVHGEGDDHLHELSGLDTAADLISVAALMHHLAPDRVIASPPALGDGVVHTAHGELAVPAPAVVVLLRGLPVAGEAGEATHPVGELTTPTGAALLAHFADEIGAAPAGAYVATGRGAGRRVLLNRPNVLRASLIDPAEGPERETVMVEDQPRESSGGHGSDEHVVLESNIDDMSPELLAHAADTLREAGAIDVWMTPALMKKGRPGVVLHVLAALADRDRLAGVLFGETSTFGLRVLPVGRLYADERHESIAIAGRQVRVRLAFVDGRLATVSPEFDDVREVAVAVGRPVKVVYEAAQAAAHKRFSAS
jgi:hypothetical protein